jgi:hypothetical protein
MDNKSTKDTPVLKTTGYKHNNVKREVDIEKNNRDYAEHMQKMYGIDLSQYINTGSEVKQLRRSNSNTDHVIKLRQSNNRADIPLRKSAEYSVQDENDRRSGKQ